MSLKTVDSRVVKRNETEQKQRKIWVGLSNKTDDLRMTNYMYEWKPEYKEGILHETEREGILKQGRDLAWNRTRRHLETRKGSCMEENEKAS